MRKRRREKDGEFGKLLDVGLGFCLLSATEARSGSEPVRAAIRLVFKTIVSIRAGNACRRRGKVV